MEILELYNENKEKLKKQIKRGEKVGIGEHILIAIVYIKNSEGKYLMQKTSKEKGGLYSSTGGHVLYNEDSKMAIIREIREELGLEVLENEIKFIGDILLGVPFADVYYLEKDVDIDKLSLQKEEVESVCYMSEEQICKLISENKITQSHGIIFEKYFYKNDIK